MINQNKTIHKPPAGTRITIKQDSDYSIELSYSKKKLSESTFIQLSFTTFWFGLLYLGTLRASQENLVLTLFTVPFWMVGIGMLGDLINTFLEKQTIKISESSFILVKDRPIGKKKYEINKRDILSIRLKGPNLRTYSNSTLEDYKTILKMQNSIGIGRLEMPAIITKEMALFFFEDTNDNDQRWLISTLNSIVARQTVKE